MKLIIEKKINYVEEANYLLTHFANHISYENMKKEETPKISYDKELYEKKFSMLIRMSKYVTERFEVEKSKLEFYFKEIGNFKVGLSYFLLPMFPGIQYDSLNQYKKASLDLDKKSILKEFDNILSQYCSIGKSGDEKVAETLEELIQVIEKGELAADDKWKIVKVYLDWEYYVNELCDILEQTIQLLKECAHDIVELERDFYEYWSSYTAEHDFLMELQDYAKVTWKYNEETRIVPMIFLPKNISFSINDEEDNKPDIIHVGIIVDSNLSYQEENIDMEKINTALKILSDKSKFEILKFIKEKPAYGYEIAGALNLSTSTISYHMNGLHSAGLVKLDKDTTKIYYSINKETITELLDNLRTILVAD